MSKYNDFAVPAFKVTCGGGELKHSEFSFTEIAADNSVGKTAGAARFTLTDVYERESRQFDADALKKLTPGTKVSIALGYGSDTTEVFTGYIDELKTRFDTEHMSLTALCLDARGLMREGSAFASVKDKKMQDAVTVILDRYKPLISSKDIKLEALEQDVNITQTDGDLDFVYNAAEARGLMFFIDCGKAVIGEAGDRVCAEFDWEQFEMDFSVRYLDEKLTAYGYDAQKMEPFSAEAKAKQSAKQESLLTVERALRLPRYIGADAAKKHIEALSKARVAAATVGTLICVGLPEVKIGQKVKINKFPLSAIGAGANLTVVSFSHRLDRERGFTTEIGVEGG
jgi:phage protein D